MGWCGGPCECTSFSRTTAEGFADVLPPSDPVAHWLRGRRPGRIFAVVETGTFCINFVKGRGYCSQPGSTDLERMS